MVVHLNDVMAGTAAGTAQILVGHPFDTVKVALQSSSVHKDPLSAARYILTRQGVRGLYTGVGPPLATVAAFNAVLFSVNGTLSRWIRGRDESTSNRNLTIPEAALIGSLSGIPVALMATPTELLKCRLQAQGERMPPTNASYTLADAKAGRILYRGPIDVLKKVVQYEGGVRGLFRGLIVTTWREVPGNGLYFATYAFMKEKLAEMQNLESTKDLGGSSLMISGGLAGLAFWVPMLPFDVVKTKLQTDSPYNPKYRGMIDCTQQILQKEGFRGLFRGAVPCWLRSLPANAVTFTAFDLTKTYLEKLN